MHTSESTGGKDPQHDSSTASEQPVADGETPSADQQPDREEWTVRQQGLGGERARGQTTLDGSITTEAGR